MLVIKQIIVIASRVTGTEGENDLTLGKWHATFQYDTYIISESVMCYNISDHLA